MEIKASNFKEVYQQLNIDLNKLGCVMLNVESPNVNINSDALYTSSDKFWINGNTSKSTPHITLLYGLMENAAILSPQVKQVLGGWYIDTVKISDVGFFDSPFEEEPYYCIVAHIELTKEIIEGHKRLELLPHINTYSEYKPHLTIAYIKKELGELYRDTLIAELKQKLIGKELLTKNLFY